MAYKITRKTLAYIRRPDSYSPYQARVAAQETVPKRSINTPGVLRTAEGAGAAYDAQGEWKYVWAALGTGISYDAAAEVS